MIRTVALTAANAAAIAICLATADGATWRPAAPMNIGWFESNWLRTGKS
jgi:hypothetical protein